MKKLLAYTLLALGLSSVPVFATSLEGIRQASYILYEDDRTVCSGQFVKSKLNKPDDALSGRDSLFLTAGHCFTSDVYKYSVREQTLDDKFNVMSEHVYYMKAVEILTSKDVALFKIIDENAKEFPVVEIATEDEGKLKFNQEVFVGGFPSVEDFTWTTGNFIAYVKSPFSVLDTKLVKAFPETLPGSSGGGFYVKVSEGDYKLAGTVIGAIFGTPLMNMFTPWESVNLVMKGYN